MAVCSLPVLCRSAWIVAFLALLSGPALAFGGDYYTSDKSYGDEGNWTISVNTTRKSCLMYTTYNDETVIEVGGDHSEGKFTYYFMFGNASWGYKEDEEYGVITKYDRRSTWTGDGIGVKVNDYKGVAVEGVKEEAVEEFAAGSRLNLRIGGRDYGNYSLSGTRKGLARMRECIAAVEDGSISLEAIAGEYEADAASPPSRPDKSHRGDTTTGGVRDDEPSDKAEPNDEAEPTYVSGSAFFVDEAGYLLTNAHVVEGCGKATLRLEKDRIEPALIVAREKTQDLALLKIRGKSPAVARFRAAPPIRLGDSVVVFGYPLTGYLSKSGNLSTGLVASLAGAGDNEAEMQISAPVQSGNSGGAVVDQSGHVVGVVVAKSNIQTLDKDDIEVIQNANFAIKGDVAKAFLDDNFVAYQTEAPGDDLRTPDVADIARAFSAQVICEVTK
ncbi:putative Peptidase S1 and S6 chymotrypsin/Hap [uncultured Pleomorphomonas sp.]|uniref:Putative Peptidase S1 and S6 chymotrypsin/Hap n=1 Tax=uncultured Pleomorphomonas sp. TaxID=442121 RepID=A0A212LPN6_9HYPH|nr:serine protease [uncultured Pleomorphomonas sp.]SCM79523.1 putative Peptidase S1 and S6 chymotrypsin/Hap [uncultured Pleomorphomonas sp.]